MNYVLLLDIQFATYIPTTLLGLLGLICGYLYFYFKGKDDNKLKAIEGVRPEDKLKAIEINLNELGVSVDTTNLAPADKYDLLKRSLNAKTKKYLIIAAVLIILAVLAAFLFYNNQKTVLTQSHNDRENQNLKDASAAEDLLHKNMTYSYVEFDGQAIDCLLDSQKINNVWKDWFGSEPLIASDITSVFDTLADLKKKFSVSTDEKSMRFTTFDFGGPVDKLGKKITAATDIPDSKQAGIKVPDFKTILAGTNPNLSGVFGFYSTAKFAKYVFGVTVPVPKQEEIIFDKYKPVIFDFTRNMLSQLDFNRPEILQYCEGTNNYTRQTLNLYKYVTRQNMPVNFMYAESQLTDDCAFAEGETTSLFYFNTPVLKAGVLAIKNNNNSAVEINKFNFKRSNGPGLRSFREDSSAVKENVQMAAFIKLMPGQTLLIPTYIYFHSLNEIKMLDERVDKKHYASLADGWLFSPSYNLDSISINNLSYPPIKQNLTGKLSLAYKGIVYEMGGSCPYVYTLTGNGQYKQEGTILYLVNDRKKERWDTLPLSTYRRTVKIKEQEDEVSYIDCIYLLEKTAAGEFIQHRADNSILSEKDGKTLTLKKGDETLLQFDHTANTGSKYYLAGYGYYLAVKK